MLIDALCIECHIRYLPVNGGGSQGDRESKGVVHDRGASLTTLPLSISYSIPQQHHLRFSVLREYTLKQDDERLPIPLP